MVNISRIELHQYVWQQPLTQLAKQWDIDARRLTELCNTFEIVRPKSGYWTQMSFGTASSPLPLDCSNFTADHKVDLSGIKRRKVQDLPKITVPKRLAKPEPEIQRAKALYRAPSYQYDYIWIAPYPQAEELMALSVSEKEFPRALRILDALLKYFKKQGWSIGTKRERRTYMNTVLIQDQTVCFRLREELKQQTLPLSDKERADKEAGRFWGREKANMPTGNLVLTLEHYMDGQQCTWRDNKKTALEDCLPEIIVGMMHAASFQQESAQRRAEQKVRWEKEREMRSMADQMRKGWNDRIESLLGDFDKWQHAQQCRNFIRQVETEMLKQGPLSSSQQRWLDWAMNVANRLDPVSEVAAADLTAWSRGCSFSERLNELALTEFIGKRKPSTANNLSIEEIEAGLKNMSVSLSESN